MKSLVLILLTLLLFAFSSVSSSRSRSAVSVNAFSLTHQHLSDGSRIASITVTGSGVTLTGNYSSTLAPWICQPCQRGDSLSFSRNIDLADAYVFSGVINGVSYNEVYLQGMVEFIQIQPAQIPPSWQKSLRVSAPVTLSGPITAYHQRSDFDHPDRAIFQVGSVSLQGTARLTLSWYLSPSDKQIYEDRFLTYEFAL